MENYTVSYKMYEMALDGFMEKYHDREKYIALCRACPNYNKKWSCPELSFDVDEYLKNFRYIYIVGAKIDLSKETIAAADTMDKVKNVGWEIIQTVRHSMKGKMLAMEEKSEGSVSLASGDCDICAECTRPQGKPCRFPEKMRYSLDAFSMNLTQITEDAFNIKIQWIKDRLPDYFTLIHALLTKKKIDERAWGDVGFPF
ncbi:MAG: DUF2284 domain-containing protein [Selenomonadaceae bacterium]